MKNNHGFTLIEIVVVLVLVGLMSLGMTTFFVNMYQAYLLAKSRTETAITMQCALSRITIELQNATSSWIEDDGSGGIVYYSPNFLTWRAIQTNGTSIDLLPEVDPDTGSGDDFQLLSGSMDIRYIDSDGDFSTDWASSNGKTLSAIQVSITVPDTGLSGGQDLTFSTRIIPRG